MSTPLTPPLSAMKQAHITVTVATLFLLVNVEVAGPRNIVDLVLAGVKAAAARWPAVVTVTER